MKKTLLLLALALTATVGTAQQVYWVFLADKAGTAFNPYEYFDAKAIERYAQCGADLYDESNYPLQQRYVDGVEAIATEEVGTSRWLNAVAVSATPAQAAAIEELPYVVRVQALEGARMQLATATAEAETGLFDKATVDGPLEAQLVRMGGAAFREKGIDGRGVRIAVLDGGFPKVNTHEAFKHLRDNKQIVKTWNFPNKKENVYGWNSHGTMTLSCIGGRMGDKDLGLATGAEYLLARTEVEAEPFKEEVWWQMAMEWADRNGANIISSSLGYGKQRYYTRDMDGTSYVARAANMAARKGILVCNSAGNEGDESEWKTIITPADADSVLCVGGIENSLTEYNHISFSSYGPSADGRQKPNVCAFGYARTANVSSNDAYHYVHGTSFSCPLVAGFAACAWQATPGKTAMELMELLERSSDLYPYCDYAYGYGVPQASYFTGERKAAEPTFRLAEEEGQIRLVPATQLSSEPIFYKEVRPDGSIVRFGKKTLIYMDSLTNLLFTVAEGNTLVVHAGGYTTQIQGHAAKSRAWGTVDTKPGAIFAGTMSTEYRDETMNTPSKWGTDATWRKDIYFAFGLPLKTAGGELASDVWSPATRLGVRIMRGLGKVYSLGFGVEYGNTRYNYMDQPYNTTETTLGADSVAGTYDEILRRYVNQGELTLELFQRIRLSSVALLTGKGFNWDLGVYGSYGWNRYKLRGKATAMPASSQNTVYYNPSPIDAYRWNWGVATRLTYDNIGLYARYRLNGIGKETPADKVLMPRLEIGAQIAF